MRALTPNALRNKERSDPRKALERLARKARSKGSLNELRIRDPRAVTSCSIYRSFLLHNAGGDERSVRDDSINHHVELNSFLEFLTEDKLYKYCICLVVNDDFSWIVVTFWLYFITTTRSSDT